MTADDDWYSGSIENPRAKRMEGLIKGLDVLVSRFRRVAAVVTSFVAWTNLFDFGILNSLVNALSEANGKDSPEEAKRYVSTAFFALIAICALVGTMFALCAGWIPWSRVLAVRIPIPESTVMWTVVAALVCVLAGLPLPSSVRFTPAIKNRTSGIYSRR